MSIYAVKVGHTPGIYGSWHECKLQIQNFPGAVYQKFSFFEEAEKYLASPHKYFADVETDWPVVFTDGSFQKGKAGAGIFFGDDDDRNMSIKVPGKQTNQRAEVYAIIVALRNTEGPIHIKTDSKYAINCATGVWSVRANQDLFDELSELMENRKVKFTHVYGHTGIHGNEMADRLAVAAWHSESN